MIGIYKIRNTVNDKVYIGQSNDIERRISQHFSQYERNRHPSYPLYLAIEKYGLDKFEVNVIEECPIEELDEKEKYWINYYQSLINQKGYNVRKGGENFIGEDHPKHKLTEKDVIDIRTRYNNHERCKEVEKLYSDRIGHSGFSKIWKGETWTHIMPEVYTKENKDFHLHNTGQKGEENGRALLTKEDVVSIRTRRNNGEKWEDVYEEYKDKGIKPGSFYNTWKGYNWKTIDI